MASHAQTPACRRCGDCCRLGGPALHRDDLPLWTRGLLAPRDLLTLRRGEWVTDNVAGGVGPSPGELVKLAPGPDGRSCRFFRLPPACTIHADRPLECRTLSCQAPQALEALYRQGRLARADLLPAGGALAALCAEHETATDLVRLAGLCARALAGDRPAREEVGRIVRLDAAFRELLPARAGLAPDTLPFYLGRPPAQALPACRAVLSSGGLYKATASA
jgi:hypothetical protein